MCLVRHSIFQSYEASGGAMSAAFQSWRPFPMNSDLIEGNWMQLKGKMREKWGKLTDNDWEQVAGKKDQLLGKLQERYGYTKEQAERDYEDWNRANQRTAKVA
jgi:uncharacterized protein YjbJ (UPF0337 family)